ncbi:MAG: hypothetical protein ACYC63_12110 [Armatimonadota bacterium]
MDETRLGQLRDFIVEARKLGESYDVIRQQLLASGWTDADVNEYLPTAWQQVEAGAAPAVPPATMPAGPPASAPASAPASMPATPPAAMPSEPPAVTPDETPVYRPPVMEPVTPAAEEKPAVYAPPVAGPPAYPSPGQTAYEAPPVPYGYGTGNTSGNPQAPVPPEVEAMGWSWGAFGLNWIWGIGNKTFIALLALIPCVNIFVAIWLGISGHKMAWQNRRFESFEQYKETMKAWNMWGLIAFLVSLVINIIMTIINIASQNGS